MTQVPSLVGELRSHMSGGTSTKHTDSEDQGEPEKDIGPAHFDLGS